MKYLSYFVLLGICLYAGELDAAEWSYQGETGPAHWGEINANCDGSRQSPIHVQPDDTVEDKQGLGDLEFTRYDEALTDVIFTIKNRGHTIQVDLSATDPASLPTIHGGGLSGTYRLAQFHFHWGSGNNRGSDHLLGDDSFAAETHFVHIKVGLTVAEALDDPEGLAVLGVLIQTGSASNNAYSNVLDDVLDVIGYSTTSEIATFALETLLPDTSKFYRYEGSQTHPPCNEAVIWTIFNEVVVLSEEQMDQLRMANATDNDGNIMDTYRPLIDIGSRVVYRNFEIESSDSDRPLVMPFLTPLLLLIMYVLK